MKIILSIISFALIVATTACAQKKDQKPADQASTTKQMKITKTDEEWKKQLTPEQYEVTRKAGTERAFTGKY